MKTNDLTSLDTGQVVDAVVELATQVGVFKTKAMCEEREAIRNQHWAASREVKGRLELALNELARRLGINVGTAERARTGLMYLGLKKSRQVCSTCKSGGGWKGKALNWYTDEGMPLPLVQAHRGAKRQVLEDSIALCKLLCSKCARKLGAEFTNGGTPIIKEWLK